MFLIRIAESPRKDISERNTIIDLPIFRSWRWLRIPSRWYLLRWTARSRRPRGPTLRALFERRRPRGRRPRSPKVDSGKKLINVCYDCTLKHEFQNYGKTHFVKGQKAKIMASVGQKNNMEEITYDIIRNLTYFKNLS